MLRSIQIGILFLVAGVAWGQPPVSKRTSKSSSQPKETYVPTGADVDTADDQEKSFESSDGSRVIVEGRGFSMIPPEGWEVSTDHPQLSLLMQVPYEKGMKYQRTIQVASFRGHKFIDNTTAQEFEELIERKFSRASASIEDYRIRDHHQVDMADGRKGLLFYSEFVLDGVALMQMHVLVSTDKRHFLMTFTDLADHFEENQGGDYLARAWDSMITIELDGKTPSRFGPTIKMGIGIVAVILFFMMIGVIRKRRAGRAFRQYSMGASLDDVGEVTQQATFIVPKTAELESSEEGLGEDLGDGDGVEDAESDADDDDDDDDALVTTGASRF